MLVDLASFGATSLSLLRNVVAWDADTILRALIGPTSMPSGLTVGKTRSQSRRLAAADQELIQPSISTRERQPSTRTEERNVITRQTSLIERTLQ
jgi:hypothetical protein